MYKAPFHFLSCILLSALTLLPSTGLAAEQPLDEVGAYFRVMWGLFIVLAIILVVYALFKKRFSIMNPRGNKSIRVLEIQPLMPRKSLCLIEVKGKEYLLGVGNDSITLLADLDSGKTSSFGDLLSESQAAKQS